MARGAGQSFLQAGAHRLSSHRLSRLYQKWAALGHSSTRALHMQGETCKSQWCPQSSTLLGRIPTQLNPRFSRVVALGFKHGAEYYPAFPPG